MKPTFASILIVFLLASLAAPATAAPVAQYITPSFTIVNASPGQSVTLQTTALSSNDTITVTMGNYGTQGVGGAVVGTINSGMGGQVTATYSIPAALRDAYQIDIRLQSTVSGLYSTNWCYNNSGSPYIPPPYYPPNNPPNYPPYYPTPGYPYPPGVTPTITISNVIPDISVTLNTYNFPAGKTFNVRMGPMGTNGVGGTLAGSFYSGNGGSMSATFSIPANLRGSYQIAIRAESTIGNYYAYDWFTNNGGYNPPYPPTPYPPYSFSFTVLSVIRDQSVTIQTNNLPPYQSFNVRMGPAGSQGINGTFVDTVTSSSGGTLVLNFYIPTNMRGMYQIDLRIESASTGSSAYNTFYNNSIGPTPPVPFESSFSVLSVIRDQSVTIQTYNFPSATTYNVSMGYPGTYYQSGTPAGTMNSGIGGSFTTSFNIPVSLRGANQLNIWLVNALTGQVLSGNFNNYTSNTYSGNENKANNYNPTFSIVNVANNSTVTILTSNFPPNDTFIVRMGPMGSQGVGGTLVGSINSGAGGSFTATFTIPSNLYNSPQIAIRLESTYSVNFAYNWFYNSSIIPGPIPGPTFIPPYPPPYPPYPTNPYYPTFSIQSVVNNSTVTILTNNFPPNDTFNCRMGPMGSLGIGGTPCGTINSGSGGSFSATFNIPPNLYGSAQIAIRLESPMTGYYAYNWFYNNSTGPWTPGPYPTPYYGYPTFSIQSVVQNSTVSVLTNNFPPNDTFICKMGPMGTAGIGGTSCGSISSGTGGSLTASFNIPPNLYGSAQIAIRLESPTTGYYAYNWFYNNSTGPWTPGPFPTIGPWTPMPTPIFVFPTFNIQSVVQNQTVTVLTSNFPVNDTFDVYMGTMGSQGIGGTKVATFSSNSGGSFTATFNIPANLVNASQIAIRMQSPYSGYYAYNWFYNSTSP